MSEALTSRRAALVTIGGSTIAVCLAGCSTGSGGSGNGSSGSGGSGGATTIAASAVPVGGGTIVGTFVVTQPSAGTFEAFNYLCTHQNLPVQQVTTSAIVCGRHGSTFSLADGAVITGPAAKPLTRATVTANGDTLTIS